MAFLQLQLRRSLTSLFTSTSLLRSPLLTSSLPLQRTFSNFSSNRPSLPLLPRLSIETPSTMRSFIMPKAIRKKSSALARPKKTARRAGARKAKRRSKRMGNPN